MDFFCLWKPLFKISKMKKKNYSFHCPTFAKMKKKILSNKHWEKWTNSRARNGVMPETMYGMSQCYHFLLSVLSETCSASIPTRATDLIGIYESDNGRKGEWISILYVKSWFSSSWLSPFSLQNAPIVLLCQMHASNNFSTCCTCYFQSFFYLLYLLLTLYTPEVS